MTNDDRKTFLFMKMCFPGKLLNISSPLNKTPLKIYTIVLKTFSEQIDLFDAIFYRDHIKISWPNLLFEIKFKLNKTANIQFGHPDANTSKHNIYSSIIIL